MGDPRGRRRRMGCLVALALAAALGTLLYFRYTGPRDLSLYPPREESPYRLPWTAGVVRLCIQGNRGIVSHRDRGEFSYDFAMPVGSPVCAAREGTVAKVDVTHEGQGTDAPNNLIGIDHGDGTIGWYLHLERGGSSVAAGDRVARGQRIGSSGNVGRSMLPHLHFHVTARGGETIPITFFDVARDAGVPRMFKRYRSGNQPPR